MLSVNGSGFKVNGKWYYINDVLKYPNTSIKRIILFGFYDNELEYEDNDCGCGFYTATVELIGNEWKLDKKSISGIDWYSLGEKEEDKDIIRAVQEVVSHECAYMDENGKCSVNVCKVCKNTYVPCGSYVINKPYYSKD